MTDTFENNARAVLDQSLDGIDAGTRARLAEARRAAVHGDRRVGAGFKWGGAGVAALAALLIALWLPSTPPEQKYIADLDLLESDGGIDFSQDDILMDLLPDQESGAVPENGALNVPESRNA